MIPRSERHPSSGPPNHGKKKETPIMAIALRRSYIIRDEIDRLPAMLMQCHRRTLEHQANVRD